MADESLQILMAIWTQNQSNFTGNSIRRYLYRPQASAEAAFRIYLAAFRPRSAQVFSEASRRLESDGNASGRDGASVLFDQTNGCRRQARSESLEIVVRESSHYAKPLGNDRHIFTRALEQIKEDATACRRIGAYDCTSIPVWQSREVSRSGWR